MELDPIVISLYDATGAGFLVGTFTGVIGFLIGMRTSQRRVTRAIEEARIYARVHTRHRWVSLIQGRVRLMLSMHRLSCLGVLPSTSAFEGLQAELEGWLRGLAEYSTELASPPGAEAEADPCELSRETLPEDAEVGDGTGRGRE